MNNNLYAPTETATALIKTTFPIKIVGKGELLGWEDILERRNYTSSIRCTSINGTVFKIDAKKFKEGTFRDKEFKQFMKEI